MAKKSASDDNTPSIMFRDPATGSPVEYLPPKTSADLKYYLEQFCGLKVADKAVCKGHCSPLDAAVAMYFAEHPIIMIEGSRGFSGKSTLLGAVSCLELAEGADVVVLGGSSRQSQRVHDVEAEIWNHKVLVGGKYYSSPFKNLLDEEPTGWQTRTKFGNELKAITASQKQARGAHPQRLRIDEADELDLRVLEAALGQTMTYNGIQDQVTVSCFAPETLITMADGTPKPIKDIVIGDQVVGISGKPETVTKVWCKPYSGRILRVKPRGLPEFRVTPEHMLWSGAGELPVEEAARNWLFSPRRHLTGTTRMRSGILRKTSCVEEEYSGVVYDLTVEPGHWYIAGGVQSHNSTHQYADGTMTEMLKRAHDNKWPCYKWCVARGTMISTPTGERPVESLSSGDLIYSYSKYGVAVVPIENAWSNGLRKTLKINTTAGELTCTPDHEILTDGGWQRADQIGAGQVVFGLRFVAETPGSKFAVQRMLRLKSDAAQCRGGGQKSRSAASESQKVPVWKTNNEAVNDVQRVLAKELDREEQGTSRGISSGSTGKLARQDIKARKTSYGAVRAFVYRLQDTSFVRTLDNRFLPASLGFVRRCVRLASHAGVVTEPRQAEGRTFNSREQESFSVVGWPAALMVRVLGVSDGPITDVWDIAVPELHNFIANGVVVHNCYKDCHVDNGGFITDDDIKRKRTMIGERMWRVEYDLLQPSIEGRILSEATIKKVFGDSRHKLIYDKPGKVYIFEKPEQGARYVTGADWAQTEDMTVIITIRYDMITRGEPARVVAIEYTNKEDWPVMVARAEERVRHYPGLLVHDGLTFGNVLQGYLNVQAFPFEARGQKRYQLYADYIVGLENDMLKIPNLESIRKQHEYVTHGDLYVVNGHPPDAVCAIALAWQGVLGKAIPDLATKPYKIGRPILWR